ncbi:MAG TPA: sugar phosphate isomerase/epimerase family protein [Planctomycetota bacterium]|nr:sugar phosphate isomerase/epimerase family protein [Planctomycetota bacterium]
MKPGITQLCLARKDFEADINQAKSCGYEAIELFFNDTGVPSTNASTAEIQGFRKACDKVGLEICSIVVFKEDQGSLLSAKAGEREKRMGVIRRGLEIAEILGVDGMLLHPGHLESTDSYERAWNDSRDALKKLAPEAEKRKCAIAIENVWNKFILSPREARQFVDEVGSPWVGFYLDNANLLHYGFSEMWVRELGKRIKKVHLKDYKRKGAEWPQLMDGDCNWKEFMKELRAIGFNGALVSEVGGDVARQKETAERIRKIIAL